MNDIEKLRLRVADAVEHFGLINKQRATYSHRLIDLMDTVEGRIRVQLCEIEDHKSKIAHHLAEIESQSAKVEGIDGENEHLRDMLHSLLQAIEEGGRDNLAETMQELEGKASALIGDGAAEASAAEAAASGIDAEAESAAEAETEAETETEPEVPLALRAGQAIEAADDTPAEAPAEVIAEADEPVAEIEEPVAEEAAEIAAEIEEPVADETAETAAEVTDEIAEPAAEAEPVAAEGAIATGDILDTPEIAEDSAENPDSGEPAEPVTEAEEPVAEDAVEPAAESAEPGSLDEIMERVSKLVQETDAAIAAPDPAAAKSEAEEPAEAPEEAAEEPAEEPAQQASAAGS